MSALKILLAVLLVLMAIMIFGALGIVFADSTITVTTTTTTTTSSTTTVVPEQFNSEPLWPLFVYLVIAIGIFFVIYVELRKFLWT